MTRFDDATARQVRAADPAQSTWVSANAGSGKTRVLTDRVARLLLGGTDPGRILCLTYTKAAAAEMQNRLFERLGSWAMMPDDRLRETLEGLGEAPGRSAEDLRAARRLFANALETPGGLKIQTIHAFCDKLLRRFPLEAGVPPQFEALDDMAALRLRTEIIDQIADGPERDVLSAFAQEMTGADLDPLLQEMVERRDILRPHSIAEIFGPGEMQDPGALMAHVLGDDGRRILTEVSAAVASAARMSADLAELATITQAEAFLDRAVALFINGPATKVPFSVKTLGNKTVRGKNAALFSDFDALAERVAQMRHDQAMARQARRAGRLADFAAAFLRRYDLAKLLAGQLDFSDLIRKAIALLESSAAAQWVLYRLDGGIDHILVDEAQDTSPDQWRIVARLAEEFTAGQGRDRGARTLFVVGDEKQSIYSFQGADPALFTDMRAELAANLGGPRQLFQEAELLHSFRTADPILRLVDAVFEGPAGENFTDRSHHIPFHTDRPGRVDIWPFLQKEEQPEPGPWYLPVDTPDPADPRKTLARRVAQWIKARIDAHELLPGTQAPIGPGDFLILVQKRGPFFNHVIKALKSLDIPVAGADRMKIAEELAVMDILSLLRWADLPDDDLSLAEALRSPLFGLSEGELYALAQPRERSLWEALRNAPGHARIRAILSDILARADYLRPFELIDRILSHHGGRERLLARLGEEAEDAIDELLSQALRFEQTNIVSLPGFLHWFASEDVTVKREMDAAAGQVRVMTVHGAKGLEAPIVILPDTGVQHGQKDGASLLPLEQGGFVWKTPAGNKDMTQEELAARTARKAFLDAEKMRLLYVAMTRAERWLVIAGAGEPGKKADACWYGLIDAVIGDDGEGAMAAPVVHEDPVVGPVRSMASGWAPAPAPEPLAAPVPVELPGWAVDGVTAPARLRPVNPSQLPGAKALGGAGNLDEAAALRRGTQMHLLLEHLAPAPRAARADIAARVLSGEWAAPPDALSGLLSEAEAMLDAPDLAWLWSADVLAEVPVTADLPSLGGRRMEGTIDRLVIGPDRIVAVDIKTNATLPATPKDTPPGILRQLGAYAEALSQIYPGREIVSGVLWTAGPRFMSVDHALVIGALKATPPS